ncbi:putative DNA-binding protein [Actinacidiphila reveromycinica]|uniref:Putative DNA-binding protein n=1 Tax=Actinacidiphila reveromycinica TaxID=659352 RepID=A0A7U3VLR6_9ACTN|nr:helix-turn-helix transcriptional regulator [Streptomyces sp. SN-593]BBA95814.1 putative DNA-binding protein [Streptomyces sp. SN-593]
MAARRQRFAERRKARGYTQERFADALEVDRTTVQRWERGEGGPHPHLRPKVALLLGLAPGELEEVLSSGPTVSVAAVPRASRGIEAHDDESDAWELARRVQASDVGSETLDRLESAFDVLAAAYPKSPPQDILQRVRRNSSYVLHLLDAKKTLAEHRRLLAIGGWLSLLGATVHIDLKQEDAATARLQTAVALARQAEHPEIEAWCYETEAWRVLTDGDYVRAVELSRISQEIAPAGSSVLIQSTAQEGRARARLGQARETYSAIERVQNMSSAFAPPELPEHHYQYDPGKSLSYTATTLAWLGDPAAEPFAREVISRLDPGRDVAKWPRRVASASIDLALVLVAGNRLDEACDAAQKAILSGRLVPSNHWRAREVVDSVEAGQLPEAVDLREAFEALSALDA